ncbi:ribosomal L7Ae/L30e/S12e/Gadd45 family protein [Candidatus Woesearchaeota archaeon]|nr:ribosomal L7Ae/L30e/S12e/Gadd45 family protein [Candidatus Woesearchaeota archaeon]
MKMDVNEIKKLWKNESLVVGSDEVLKLLRRGELEKVLLAKNAPAAVVEDVKRFASLKSVEVETLEIPNDELGTLCKKPFSIAVLGLKKSSGAAKRR